MTRTPKLNLYTWVKTDTVDVTQISSNFQTLDTVCDRADNMRLLGTGNFSSGTAFSAALSNWDNSKFNQLMVRFCIKVTTKSSGLKLIATVKTTDNTSTSLDIGSSSESTETPYEATGQVVFTRLGTDHWDVEYHSTFGRGASLFSAYANDGFKRIALEKAKIPSMITLTAERYSTNYSQDPILQTGSYFTVYGAL